MQKLDPEAKKTKDKGPERTSANQRTIARLGAVQALYQMDIGQTSLEQTLTEFTSHRLGKELEGDEYLPADHDFFTQIVKGVTKVQLEIDPQIDAALIDSWPVTRIDATLRAILRAASFELRVRVDIPQPVVINEYVEIAKSFFDDDAPGMVNSVLDKIAREQKLAIK